VSKFVSLLITGIFSGAIYSMLAAGLTLTYTTTGIFNLGYGAVAFTCAYAYFELQNGLGWPNVWAGIVVILVLAPLLGFALDRFVFRRLSQASDASKIMATVGVLVAVPALAQYIVSLLISVGHFNIPDGSLVSLAPGLGPEPPKQWHLSSAFNFDSDQLIVAIVALLMAVGLWWLLKHTSIGLKMRALVDRPELATARGVDRGRTSGFAWILGTTLAGLAGVAGAPIFNSLTTGTYLFVLLAAAAAAVLGGFRSVPLAALGGLVIGAVQSLVAGYANFAESIPGFSDAVPFVLLFIGLAYWGRERGRRAGTAAEDVPPPDYLALRPPWRRSAPWVFWFVVLVVYILFGADSYWLGLATEGLALSVVFLSFTIVTGTGGIVSLAQAAFVTGAGLMCGVLIGHYHVPYFPALLGGVAFAVLLGVVVAIPALRLGGLSLALATLAMGLVADNVLFQWGWLAGPLQQGWAIPQPTIGPFHLSDNKTMAVVLAIIVIAVTLLIRNLQKSASGRMMSAVRTSESAASTSGISANAIKITLFAVSAGLAGLGGVLLVTVEQHVTNSTYTTIVGLTWLAIVVLWGIRRPSAAIAAGMGYTLFNGVLSSGFHFSFISWSGTSSVWLPQVLFGLGAITMAQNPDGILSLQEEQGFRRKQKKAAKLALRATAPAVAPSVAAAPLAADTAVPVDGAPAVVTNGHGSAAPVVAPQPARLRAEDAALRLDSICAAYGETQVLFDLDLDVRRGKLTALVGANGAGKSTLCKVIAGLMEPSGGTITLDGRDITTMPAHRRAKYMLLAPESRGIFPGLSVEDNLMMLLPSADERDQAYARFPVLGSRRHIPAGNLSGGEQQMLTMAPVMVKPPSLLIADEPTLGLAPLIVEQIMGVFAELRDQGVTLLVVEERAKAVLDIADDVALLELGRLIWDGPRAELDPAHLTAIYLGQSTVEDAPTPA
jgi:ABC-type branched-subunit amino acid transport system ATPase component/branched-subunit amino acid ABC-type transport system permease component